MGAHSICDIGCGKDESEAYSAIVSAATYVYGHDSYNGTISTSNGCFIVKPSMKILEALRTVSSKRTDTQKQDIKKFEEGLLGRTNKWGPVAAVKLSEEPDSTGRHKYMFIGWAAS